MRLLSTKNLKRLQRYVYTRVATRWHMSLILSAVAVSGIISSKIMLLLGVEQLTLRLGIAFSIAYLCFFIFVRIWIHIVNPTRNNKSVTSNASSSDSSGNIDLDGSSISLPDFSNGGSSGSADSYSGGGGSFGGAGASASWTASPGMTVTPAALDSDASPSLKMPALELPDLDLGDSEGGGAIILVIALLVLLAVILGGAIYIVYQAPVILSEALFEFLLSSGLVRSVKKLSAHNWIGSVLRVTWIPALIMLGVTLATGFVAEIFCPNASTLFQVWQMCI
ncbi:MAG: hypothetical protein KDK39_11650 [Leptospiraceae bacterium]|nr:hypothetical protein [Leptospiraceae bacterium]